MKAGRVSVDAWQIGLQVGANLDLRQEPGPDEAEHILNDAVEVDGAGRPGAILADCEDLLHEVGRAARCKCGKQVDRALFNQRAKKLLEVYEQERTDPAFQDRMQELLLCLK